MADEISPFNLAFGRHVSLILIHAKQIKFSTMQKYNYNR